MAKIPLPVQQLLDAWRKEFSPSVAERFPAMIVAVLVLRGRRSVLRLYPLVVRLVPGHWSSLHRVFSQRRWRTFGLATALTVGLRGRTFVAAACLPVHDAPSTIHRGKQLAQVWQDCMAATRPTGVKQACPPD